MILAAILVVTGVPISAWWWSAGGDDAVSADVPGSAPMRDAPAEATGSGSSLLVGGEVTATTDDAGDVSVTRPSADAAESASMRTDLGQDGRGARTDQDRGGSRALTDLEREGSMARVDLGQDGSVSRGGEMGRSARPMTDQPPSDQTSGMDGIRGQLLFTDGSPVSGATVVARAVHLFDEMEMAQADEARVITGGSGRFEFRGLGPGEYSLTATVSGTPSIVGSATVRTGSDQVRLVMGRTIDLWVDGLVMDPSGAPLADVMVAVIGHDISVPSAADGRFGFFLTVPDHRHVGLSLMREGFEPGRASLDPATRDAMGVVVVDATLKPVQGQLTVAGHVLDVRGRGLSGKSVYLSQNANKYRATTDATGAFVITGIRGPGLYHLAVSADGLHTGHQNPRFNVPAGGLRGHVIELAQVGAGSVHGVMFDVEGRPMPNFTLMIQSSGAPQEGVSITSDVQGHFAAQDVPEGKLRIQSRSFPRFITSGLDLAAGEVLDVDVLLDHGERTLAGRVTNDSGRPMAGVDLTLSWVLRDGSIVHESLRKTTTDRAGEFVFTRLGADAYDLSARAPHHAPWRIQGLDPMRSGPLHIELTQAVQ